MSQTLVIRTPDAVSTTSRTFPKQGVFNLKIIKNDRYDTVEIWVSSRTSGITLELAGASFQSTAIVSTANTIPPTPTVISGSTLALTSGAMHYMKIKLNNGISVAYLRCSYAAKNTNTIVAGGNIYGQAFVDYSKKPYIATSMYRMFVTHPVRSDITKWDISSVTDLRDMFFGNTTFNQPIGDWDVSNVTSMNRMFLEAQSFNQPIGNWNVGKVTNMSGMFLDTKTFNQPIGDWDVSNVVDMAAMFSGSSRFNQPIGNWNVSKLITLSNMFEGATAFNQPIGNWDVSNVTSMNRMFLEAKTFNQPIGDWNVSNVVDMTAMFAGAKAFNYPISNWDISKVTNMANMFSNNISFNQDLSSWTAKFHVNVNLNGFFLNSTWGTTNYDKFLNALWTDINTTRPQAWSLRTVPKILGMGSSKYSAASATARDSLVSNGWTITDGGLAE